MTQYCIKTMTGHHCHLLHYKTTCIRCGSIFVLVYKPINKFEFYFPLCQIMVMNTAQSGPVKIVLSSRQDDLSTKQLVDT